MDVDIYGPLNHFAEMKGLFIKVNLQRSPKCEGNKTESPVETVACYVGGVEENITANRRRLFSKLSLCRFLLGAVIKSVTFYFFREGFLILFSLIINKLR